MTLHDSWESDAPLVIAHRGASAYAPENTVAAFEKAVEFGADAIELDAKLTADGVVVIHHDRTLDRTTNGTGPISKCTLDELLRLDAGTSFGTPFRGERIPTLEQVFSTYGEQLLINVELTNYASPFDPLPERAVQLVREFGLEERVLFSSFNPLALIRAQRAANEVRCGLLVMNSQPRWLRFLLRLVTPHQTYHPQHELVEHILGRPGEVHRKPIYAWTVNDINRMKTLLDNSIDGLITDVPDQARQVVESRMDGHDKQVVQSFRRRSGQQ